MTLPPSVRRRVAVVLCTYNGAPYLPEQLDSLARSTIPVTHLRVHDDQSQDTSVEVIRDFADSWSGACTVTVNPERLGYARNFLQALCALEDNYDWIFLCDQDDVWHPGKIERAIAFGARQTLVTPYLYASRQRLVSESGDFIKLSPDFRTPRFSRALMQNVTTGCTVMINPATLKLLRDTDPQGIVYHDWWLYALVAGAGGHVDFDPDPWVDYRQHARNAVGSPKSVYQDVTERLDRLWRLESKEALLRLEAALLRNANVLTPRNARMVAKLSAFRQSGFFQRLRRIATLPVRRHTRIDTVIAKILLTLGYL